MGSFTIVTTAPSLYFKAHWQNAQAIAAINFAKESFHLSRSNAGLRDCETLIDNFIKIKNRQCLTANISKLRVSGLFKVRTFNKILNSLILWWLGNPSLLILASRWQA